MPDPHKVTTQDTQGNDKTVEIHGRKADQEKGVTIVGTNPGGKGTKIVEQKPS